MRSFWGIDMAEVVRALCRWLNVKKLANRVALRGLFAMSMLALLVVAVPQSSFAQSMTLPGKFSVGSSGSATYNVPIALPPGTAGLVPSLSLEYNSQGSNGLLGIGWALGGLPSIGRCPQTVAQDGALGAITFNSSDRFCMDGQRLVLISGTYGADGAQYRTEVETFSEIVSHGTAGNGPAWFEVHTKSGQIMQFGNTTDSQVLAKGTSTARSWALNKVSDTKGNYFTVTYTNDTTNGQAYPIEIDYTGNAAASLSPSNKVQLVYATRPDIAPQYVAGSFSQTTVRLTDIKTFAGAMLVADYKLSYGISGGTSRSILTSVQLCDGSSPANCLPATSFTWQGQSSVPGNAGFTTSWAGYSITTGDFNGDGTTDILICPSIGGAQCFLYYVNGSALTQGMTPIWGAYQVYAADFNGDGKADLLGCPSTPIGAACLIYYSTGMGFTQGSFSPGWGGYQIAVADFDGDGRADLFACPPPTRLGSSTCNIYYSTETSFNQGGFSASWGGGQIAAADFNGDGRADIFVCPPPAGLRSPPVGSACYFYYSTGTSFSPSSFSGGWAGDQFSFGDFNGDGLADFIVCPATNAAACQIEYSTGTSFIESSFTPPWGNNSVSVGDFNNDGKADFIVCPPPSAGLCTPYLSTGTSFVSYGFNPSWSGYTIALGDWSGVGASGILAVPGGGQAGSAQQYLTSFAAELLTVINNGLSTTNITYTPLTNNSIYSKDSTASYPHVDVQSPIYVVSQVTNSNGVGGTYNSNYTYAGAKLDLTGRGFLGFRQMTVNDPQTGITDVTNYLQSFPYLGLVSSTTRSSGSQTLAQSTNAFQFTNANGTTTISPSSAPYQVSLSQNVSSGSDLDGSALPSVTTTNQYDTLGNATQVAVSTSDGYGKTTNNTYTNDTANWFLGRLTASTVTAQAPQQLGQYCTLPWGSTISNGQSVTAYSTANAPVGQACSTLAQTRTCTNGTLSGSYTQQACAMMCALPWGGSINSGQSVTAYSAASVPSPQACSSVAETRTCGAGGTLSGSNTFQSCVVRQPKVVVLTSGTSWTVPADWSNANNTIEVIGGGGGGGGSGLNPNNGGGSGGGGGAYSKVSNVSLTPNSTVTIQIGAGGGGGWQNSGPGVGGDTWFNGPSLATSSVGAKGGAGGTYVNTTGAGGSAGSGVGTTKFSGGTGASGGPAGVNVGGGGGGGGGAAGPKGAGFNGNSGTTGFSGAGGSGGAGSGGSGGSAAGYTGGNGTDLGTAGSGGGGGGDSGAGNPGWGGTPGGKAGSYGGGGGGGGGQYSNGPSVGVGGAGAPGVIVITYVPPS